MVGAAVAVGAAAGAAQAATITVNSLADTTTAGDAQCTLREALANANTDSDTTGGDCTAGSGPDTINISSPGTITLTGGQLLVSDSATINGPGVTIDGNNASRIFYVYSNSLPLDVTISGLTLTKGSASLGSAILDKGEKLTIASSTVTGNTGEAVKVTGGGVPLTVQNSLITGTTNGRGLHADHVGAVSITGSTVSNNNATGKGAGIFLYQTGAVTIDSTIVSGNTSAGRAGGAMLYVINGALAITNSRFTGNQAGSRGGAINFYKPLDNVLIQNTTISGNTSSNRGGGLFFYKHAAGKTVTIDSSTISGNQAGATFAGGGIFLYKEAGSFVIENSTISGNSAQKGGGIYDYNIPAAGSLTIRESTIDGNTATVSAGNLKLTSFPTVTIRNTIIADGTAPASPDFQTGASNVTMDYSLLEDTTGATFAGANDIIGVDPQLGPLANNGGPTLTQRPAATSPVVNAGDAAFAPPPATDQRGFSRVSGGRIDIGSVELNGGTIQLSSATYTVSEGGGTATITITRTGGVEAATVNYATSNGSAVAPADYTATSGTATFAAGASSASFTVPIVDDAVFEGNETFNVTLSNPSNTATLGSPSSGVVTIVDNDAQPTLSISSVSQNEGNSGTTPFVFQVTLAGATSQPVTVNYATSNGSATAGSDYTATSGTLTFAPGTTSQTITVNVTGDTTFEPNETFNVTLSSPTNATIANGTGLGTIQNDDAGTADVGITKTAAPGGYFAGMPVTFNIGVTNSGPNAANAVVVNDTIPAGATFVSATPSQGSCSGTTTVTCTLGTIANGGSATIALKITPSAAGPLSNTATVSDAPQPDPNPANDSATASVTVQPASAIPALDVYGKLILAIATALAGLFVMRKQS